MKTCMVCGYEEKDNSSLFCSKCGKTFRNETANVPNPKRIESAKKDYPWQKIVGYLLIAFLIIDGLVMYFSGMSTLLVLTLIPTAVLFLAIIRLKYSYSFEGNKNNEEFNEDNVKLRPPAWHH